METNEKPIRVLTIDDHEIMRDGIRFMLLAIDDLELIGEARRGEEGIEQFRKLQPDVVLVDMKMPGMDGVETTAALKLADENAKVLILTSFHDSDLVRRAMQAGAAGYLLKDASKEELAAAIRSAHHGHTTISAEAAQDLLTDVPQTECEFSERELEIVAWLAKGMSNKEIGKQIHRSPYTVRHHVSQLIKKLNATNRAEVAAIATERGLV